MSSLSRHNIVNMYKIVITGGIACGKSLFSDYLRDLGVEILDCDDVVHELEASKGSAVLPIAETFGQEMIKDDGSVDRQKLGSALFGDPDSLQKLNAIVHPLVDQYVENWFRQKHEGIPVVVIPLLFEIEWENRYDCVIALISNRNVQIERLMQLRNCGSEEAEARVASQLPTSEKAARAHIVVYNNGSADALKSEAERVLSLLKKRYE